MSQNSYDGSCSHCLREDRNREQIGPAASHEEFDQNPVRSGSFKPNAVQSQVFGMVDKSLGWRMPKDKACGNPTQYRSHKVGTWKQDDLRLHCFFIGLWGWRY